MLSPHKLERLNDLARISKMRPLTQEERAEQQELRNEYLENFRKGFRDRLDHIHLDKEDS